MPLEKPKPPATPEGLTPSEQAEFLRTQGIAYNFKHKAGGAYLSAIASTVIRDAGSPESFIAFLEDLLSDAGNPEDPIERMLIEQISLAYHQLGALYVLSSSAATVDERETYYKAAARLLGEFRRSVLALKDYRAPAPQKNLTLVKQQNVAHSQQIAYVQENDAATLCAESSPAHSLEKQPHSKQGSSPHEALEYAPQHVPFPQASCRRETELVEA